MRHGSQLRRDVLALLGAGAGTAVVALLDHATGAELAFSVFYLLPIMCATWFGRHGWGTAAALVAVVVWGWVELVGGVYAFPPIVIWNTAIRLALFLIVVVLLRTQRDQLHLAVHHARTDSLTGLATRGRFVERLEEELTRMRRYDHPLSVAYFDVDDFKEINDRAGHAAGDRALRAIATALRTGARGSDVAARMGGDEFTILMPETGPREAQARILRLRGELSRAAEGAGTPATSSIGVLTFLTAPDDADAAIHGVDELMYAVKRAGKDDVLHRVWERPAGAAPTDGAPDQARPSV